MKLHIPVFLAAVLGAAGLPSQAHASYLFWRTAAVSGDKKACYGLARAALVKLGARQDSATKDALSATAGGGGRIGVLCLRDEGAGMMAIVMSAAPERAAAQGNAAAMASAILDPATAVPAPPPSGGPAAVLRWQVTSLNTPEVLTCFRWAASTMAGLNYNPSYSGDEVAGSSPHNSYVAAICIRGGKSTQMVSMATGRAADADLAAIGANVTHAAERLEADIKLAQTPGAVTSALWDGNLGYGGRAQIKALLNGNFICPFDWSTMGFLPLVQEQSRQLDRLDELQQAELADFPVVPRDAMAANALDRTVKTVWDELSRQHDEASHGRDMALNASGAAARGLHEKAVGLAMRVLAAVIEIDGSDKANFNGDLRRLADELESMGWSADPLTDPALKQSIAVQRCIIRYESVVQGNFEAMDTRFALADLYERGRRPDEAAAVLQESLADLQLHDGDDVAKDRNRAWVASRQGEILMRQKRWQDAEAAFRIVGNDTQHPEWDNLARVLEAEGRYREAEAIWREKLNAGVDVAAELKNNLILQKRPDDAARVQPPAHPASSSSH